MNSASNIKPILFTHYGDEWIRGSERCLLDLLSHIDRDQYKPVVWSNNTLLIKAVEQLNITTCYSDFPILLGWNKPRFNISAYVKLIKHGIKLIRQHKITLIHSNSAAPNQWLNIVARFCRLPLLVHLHSFYPLRDHLSLGLHHTSIAVAVSQPVINQLLEDGMNKCQTRVIANGIDIERFKNSPTINLHKLLSLEPSSFIMVSTGSLIRRKGIDLLIKSVSLLVSRGIPAHLLLVGNGPDYYGFLQLSIEIGISDNITFLPEQKNIPSLLKGADLYVSASREEAFGLSIAEASLSGIAVVATLTGGIPDVVIHGKTGLLVPTNSCKDISNAITHLYQAPKLREQMGKLGHEHISKNYSMQAYVKHFENIYADMINDPNMSMSWFSKFSLYNPYKLLSAHLQRRLFRSSRHD